MQALLCQQKEDPTSAVHWAGRIRELGLFWQFNLFVRVGFVVELKGIVGMVGDGEFLFFLIFHSVTGGNPVQQFRAVFLIFRIGYRVYHSVVALMLLSLAANFPKYRLTSSHMSLPSKPWLYTFLDTPFTVTWAKELFDCRAPAV